MRIRVRPVLSDGDGCAAGHTDPRHACLRPQNPQGRRLLGDLGVLDTT